MKRPDRASQIVIVKGHSNQVSYQKVVIIWSYCAPGMMGYDTIASLPDKTKFDGPIKKPKWTKEG